MIFPWKITAEEEYKRYPELKREDVQGLQEWMKSIEYLPIIDEEMVCHFLHACLYNVERTKICIEKFYTLRGKMPRFFDDWDPNQTELHNAISNVLLIAPLPIPDEDGNRIILTKFKDSSPDKFNFPICVKWMSMLCFYVFWEEGIQPGYVILSDVKGYTMSHFLKCSMTDIKNQSEFGKEASPMRIVKLVYINSSSLVKKLHNLIKHFLPKELADMMSMHSDAESYFQTLPKEAVPEDYGGSGPSTEEIHRKYVDAVIQHREWIMAESEVRVKKVEKDRKSNLQKVKVDTSLKTLEFD